MVFQTYTLVMRPRNHKVTAQTIKELCLFVYGQGGAIRKINNEGLMMPYKQFRDANNVLHRQVRYWTLQLDMGDEAHRLFVKQLQDNPEIVKHLSVVSERAAGLAAMEGGKFRLDSFTRMDEELAWPPQASTDAFELFDAQWKEVSRTRWSNFLRS
jgi:ribosomal protein S6